MDIESFVVYNVDTFVAYWLQCIPEDYQSKFKTATHLLTDYYYQHGYEQGKMEGGE